MTNGSAFSLGKTRKLTVTVKMKKQIVDFSENIKIQLNGKSKVDAASKTAGSECDDQNQCFTASKNGREKSSQSELFWLVLLDFKPTLVGSITSP